MNKARQPLQTEEIIQLLQEHFESLFPKTCPNCQRHFESLGEYVRQTNKLGSSHSYDAEEGDWEPAVPVGSSAMSNCPCGNTLSLTTDDMEMKNRYEVLKWIQARVEAGDTTTTEALDYLRGEIRKRAVAKFTATCQYA
ncbi:MAG: hypothetical protein U5O39_14635 [Gammaproteobacteria bacterium]|nr:hypothetical protein [Gammaproteobacteria bacterium]